MGKELLKEEPGNPGGQQVYHEAACPLAAKKVNDVLGALRRV